MKSLLKVSAGALALMAGAGIAAAQDSATTGTQSDVTCAQIVTLDPDEAERALYFVAGYQAAQDSGMPSDTTAGAQMPTTEGATGADTSASADAATDDALADTDTTASADTQTDTTAGTNTTASAEDTDTMGDTEEGTDTTTTAGTTASGEGTASEMLGGSGYFEIPVETVMTACEDAPESSVSDILGQQGSGGAAQ